MIVLGLDTGGNACALALWQGAPGEAPGTVLTRRVSHQRHGQGEVLIGLVDALVGEAGHAPTAIDLIGVTVGPGSFTGLRLGLAAAGGLSLALGAGIVGVSSFDALNAGLPPIPHDVVRILAIDSRRAEPFIRLIGSDGPLGQDGWRDADALVADLPAGALELAGDGAALVAAALDRVGRRYRWLGEREKDTAGAIDPVLIACLAAADADRAGPDPPVPAYLRPPDAKPPAPR